MKINRLLITILTAGFLSTAFGADPSGSWKWSVSTPNGDLETTLTLVLKDGNYTGTYSNSFGDTAISNAVFKDNVLSFDVERSFDGNKFVLKYQGRLDADTIKGTIEMPGFNGSEARKMDWLGKRAASSAAKEKPAGTKG